MPELKQIQGVMSNVSLQLLMKYINTTFPGLKIIQITAIADKEYQFILQKESEVIAQ